MSLIIHKEELFVDVPIFLIRDLFKKRKDYTAKS